MNTVHKRSYLVFLLILLLLPAVLLCSCRSAAGIQNTPAQSKSVPTEKAQTKPPVSPEPGQVSSMAVLRIDTEQEAAVTSKEEYVACSVSAENCEEPYRFSKIAAKIRVRGNSTAAAEKKPYRLRFDQKQALLGINGNAECKNWCLMADYFDPSMMRTSTAFRLGSSLLEGKYYCSDFTYAQVYLNREYLGVYLVCEQSQINPNRVAIFEKEDGYTGTDIGYLMIGQGGRTDEPNTIRLYANVLVTDLNGESSYCGNQIFSLSGGDYTKEQLRFAEDWCTAVFQAVYAALYLDEYYTIDAHCRLQPKTDFHENASKSEKQQETIGALVDLESAVRMYILDEIVKNLDAGTFNMYLDMSASGSHKLTFAAPWDFDFALANTKYDTTFSPEGFYAANFSYSDGVRTNSWYVMLNGAEWFRERVRTLWQEKYPALLTDADKILSLSETYKNEFSRNYQKWDLLGKKLLFHQHDSVCSYTSQYDAAQFLSDWLKTRLEWLNREWSGSSGTKTDFTNLDFSKHELSGTLGMYHGCERTAAEGGCVLTVTDPADPYAAILYAKSSETLSAEKYRYFEITCMAPADNSMPDYTTELFLAAGETAAPEGGKSVLFSFPADGKFHTFVLDLGATDFWSGAIHMIRIDFFCRSGLGDTYVLQSARLLEKQP
ncbi:MAG: CotH kinase family protein [Clostridia bacterium]